LSLPGNQLLLSSLASNMNHCLMEGTNSHRADPAKDALGIDPDGSPMNESWSYPSVVGMLLYLSINTHQDICFLAVSQVCQFTHNSKQSHASAAVKIIVRYLARTIDRNYWCDPNLKALGRLFC
jgi:hypothetical protein